MKILVLNAGSSSHKSRLYEMGETLPQQPLEPVWEAKIDWSHQQGVAELRVQTAPGDRIEQDLTHVSRPQAIAQMLQTLCQGPTQVLADLTEIKMVGHRVVHGGAIYRQSTVITPQVKQAIADLAILAPLHNPMNVEGIDAIEQVLGDRVPQVAVFDTAFHAQIPEAAAVYPGPYSWAEEGIRRYGFHGISHQYCAQRAAQILGRELAELRLITCHLGNGCSLAAIRNGHSIDTTMGFTPLEGLMMGSRSGSIDPGILIHLLRAWTDTESCAYAADQLEKLLNQKSGLKGISGVSGDLRAVLEAMAAGNPRAKLAFEMFVHRLRSHIGAMLPTLGGLDVLVFTAGMGENRALLRSAACEAFEFLGVKLNPEKNQDYCAQDQDIAAPDSTVRVMVIHTQEDWAIAQECLRLSC